MNDDPKTYQESILRRLKSKEKEYSSTAECVSWCQASRAFISFPEDKPEATNKSFSRERNFHDMSMQARLWRIILLLTIMSPCPNTFEPLKVEVPSSKMAVIPSS